MDKCHYCDKYTSEKQKYYEHTMYEILNTSLIPGANYTYREKKISIPRCSSCYSKHSNKSIYVDLSIFLLSMIGMYIFFEHMIGFTFILLIPSILVSMVSTYILSSAFDLFFTDKYFKVKAETDIEEYIEIRTLLNLGWKMNKKSSLNITEKDISKTSPYRGK